MPTSPDETGNASTGIYMKREHCCITLRSHLEFGDFLLRQSNFQKDALFYSTIPTLRDSGQR